MSTLTNLKNKKIIIGITGGIAAYKIPELVRIFRKSGAEVKVIMTQAAHKFVTPLTLQTVSQNQVYSEQFALINNMKVEHIELAKWADLILIAPATANFMAKLALGLADDLLTTVCLATKSKIAVAPAMNKNMWLNSAMQKNSEILVGRDIKIFGPTAGELACGEDGIGRMLEVNDIAVKSTALFEPPLFLGKKILITAGPTQEVIDPVRYLSNFSSGKMGYALARAARELGAEVTLITGPTSSEFPTHVTTIPVASAQSMCKAALEEAVAQDIFISAAAVADYTPSKISTEKIKKNSATFSLKLVKTRDIVTAVANLTPRPFTVGFAAETENLITNAKTKLKNKKLDLIVANLVGKNLAFNSDVNEVIVLGKNNFVQKFALQDKNILAKKLMYLIAAQATKRI